MGWRAIINELRVSTGIGTGSAVSEYHSIISERLGLRQSQVGNGDVVERY
jgi:hypothetical protein